MPFRKHTILLLGSFFMSLLTYAELQPQTVAANDSLYNHTTPLLTNVTPDSLLNYGKLFLNTPYRYGACGAEHFDCSGFTSYVFGNFGYHLDRSSAEQANQFPAVDKSQLKPGDLVFFNGRRRNGKVGHVGIVVKTKENGEFDFIHASVQEGVTVSSSTEEYYLKRFVKAARVFCSDDLTKILTSSAYINSLGNGVQTVMEKVTRFIPAKYHVVQHGDNLSTIALKYGIAVTQLKKQNKLKRDNIAIKQRLLIEKEKKLTVVEKVPVKNSTLMAADTTKSKPVLKENEKTQLATSTHKVKNGESLYTIAKLYDISMDDIMELNQLKDSKIFPGQEIIVNKKTEIARVGIDKPVNNNDLAVSTAKTITHKVKKGETLGEIAEKYNLSQKELIELNGLKGKKILAGQKLKVGVQSQNENVITQNVDNDQLNTTNESKTSENFSEKHKVIVGESLYSISKKYNISIDELKELNNLSSNNIKPGMTIKITSKPLASVANKTKTKSEKVSTHKVRSGENLTTIAQHYSCSIKELKEWNNKSSDKLTPGERLKVYVN